MPQNNEDFDTIFTEAVAEVEAGGGESGEARKQNARIHQGDGVVEDPQSDILDAGDKLTEGDEDEEESDDDGPPEEDDDGSDSEDEESDADQPSEFDLAAHKDELVTVKVNGEEMSVPLGEALNGYMRQADYTRKTQEVAGLRQAADWGKQMRDALLEDPQGLINGLAASFGITQIGENEDADDLTTDDPELAPVFNELKSTKRELAEMRQFMERQQQEVINASVQAELKQVREDHPDFDDNSKEILQLAIDRRVGIEEAYFIFRGRNGVKAPKPDTSKADAIAAAEAKKRNLKKAPAVKRAEITGPKEADGLDFADMLEFNLAKSK